MKSNFGKAKSSKKDKTSKKTTALTSKTNKKVIRLYVAGMTRLSRHAIENMKKICKEDLKGTYDLEVIDICKNPTLARDEQIVATPKIIIKVPPPLRRFLGDMSNKEKILVGLQIKPIKK